MLTHNEQQLKQVLADIALEDYKLEDVERQIDKLKDTAEALRKSLVVRRQTFFTAATAYVISETESRTRPDGQAPIVAYVTEETP